MSLLKNLVSDDSIANEKDSIGSGGLFESGLQNFKVALAYLTQASSKAVALNLSLKNPDGKELRSQIYITSGEAKGCKNTYVDKEGATQYLPGYLLANSLALLTVGKDLNQLDTEDKVVNVYSYEAKAEVPTKVAMIVDLLGQEVIGGVLKQVVDKNKKNESTGQYEPTGETREENELDKFFRARDRKTTQEIRGNVEASFIDVWNDKWAGKVKNKASGGAQGTSGAPKAGAAKAAGTAKPTTSLFA